VSESEGAFAVWTDEQRRPPAAGAGRREDGESATERSEQSNTVSESEGAFAVWTDEQRRPLTAGAGRREDGD